MGIYCGYEALCVPDQHVTTLHDLFGRESLDLLSDSMLRAGDSRGAERIVSASSSSPDEGRRER